jgi:sec-independent protein translocase protein TatA
MRPGVWQLVIVVLIILLLFGARRLPDLARSVGQSLKIFKSEVKDLQDDTPRAVEGRRDEATTPPVTDGASPATPTSTEPVVERRPADGDRGSTA